MGLGQQDGEHWMMCVSKIMATKAHPSLFDL